MRPHPKTLAEAVCWTVEGRDVLAVLVDEFLDAFYESDADSRAAMLRDEPLRLGREIGRAHV